MLKIILTLMILFVFVFPSSASVLLTGIDITNASIGCFSATVTVDLGIGEDTATVTVVNTTTGTPLATVALGAASPATGHTQTIPYNSSGTQVSEGDLLLITVSGGNFSDQVRGFADCSTNAGNPPLICDDGRININLCEPIAIYPTSDDEGVHMTVMIFEHGAPDSRFGFFVSAQQLASLPRTQPHPMMRVAQSQDGFAVLYWLASNEYQINAGPDFEGKTFVFRFAVFPNQTPIVETFFGGARIPLTSSNPTTPATTASGDVTEYVVQPGDNLFRIGLRFGVPYQQLAAFNNISDPTRIFVGQVIRIPR